MKLKFLILFILISFSGNSLLGQSVSLKVGQYYSTYVLTDLNNFQSTITSAVVSTNNIPFKAVDQFPPHFSYQLSVGLNDSSSIEYGVIINYSSTGARSIYSDYSGSFKIDLLLDTRDFGGYAEYSNPISTDWNLILGAKTFYTFTYFTIKDNSKLWDEEISNKTEFESNSFVINPYAAIGYSFDILFLRLEAGINVDFTGDIHLPDDEERKLRLDGNSAVTTNWTGARLGITIGLRL